MPNFAPATAEGVFSSSGAKTIAEEIIADIELAWREILYMCLVALGNYYIDYCQILTTSFKMNQMIFVINSFSLILALSLVMMVLFRFLAAVIVYIILIVVSLACVAGTIFTW